MRITVVWAGADVQDLVTIDLPADATVADAVERSGLLAHYRLDPARLGYAIFGHRAGERTRLVENDRVEITRALTADPKERRLRRARMAPLAKPQPRSKRRPGG